MKKIRKKIKNRNKKINEKQQKSNWNLDLDFVSFD